jgi:hypothetical protein
MILKRFNTENNHIDYINYKSNNIINENNNNIILESKIELLANISKNWNNELKKEYYNIKSLYKYNIAELKEIREEYILKNKKNDVNEKKKTSINKEINMDFKNENIVDSSLYDSVAELQMKYGKNEAIKEIYINENKIYIDLLCDTDITQSVVEYNGHKIVYNKICELSNENEVEYNLQDKLVEQSIFMYKNLFN